MSKIITPQEFAYKIHNGQMYGNVPYTDHLEDTVKHIENYMNDTDPYVIETVVGAGFLHDSVEENKTTHKELLYLFGSNLADLVQAVTDEPGANRKERKAKTLPKIRAYGEHAVLVKLCDRLANVISSGKNKPELLKMYRKEHSEFQSQLKLDGEHNNLWEDLDYLIKYTNG